MKNHDDYEGAFSAKSSHVLLVEALPGVCSIASVSNVTCFQIRLLHQVMSKRLVIHAF